MRRLTIGLLVVSTLLVGVVHDNDVTASVVTQPALTRRQWVNAVLRHTTGVTRAEARRIWRHPQLRRSMPIASQTSTHGESWVNPAGVQTKTVGGCHVWSSKTEYGYGIRMVGGTPVPARDPLFSYTLHRTWTYDGWRVFPSQQWDDDWIAPFADLRWNFDGAFDIEDFYLQVGASPMATHMHSRKGKFSSIVQLGSARTDLERWILAKWHGGWETPGHSAHFCTDD